MGGHTVQYMHVSKLNCKSMKTNLSRHVLCTVQMHFKVTLLLQIYITANISVLVEDTPNYNPRRWRRMSRELNIYKIHEVRDNQDSVLTVSICLKAGTH